MAIVLLKSVMTNSQLRYVGEVLTHFSDLEEAEIVKAGIAEYTDGTTEAETVFDDEDVLSDEEIMVAAAQEEGLPAFDASQVIVPKRKR